jgi:hypothetical protein
LKDLRNKISIESKWVDRKLEDSTIAFEETYIDLKIDN